MNTSVNSAYRNRYSLVNPSRVISPSNNVRKSKSPVRLEGWRPSSYLIRSVKLNRSLTNSNTINQINAINAINAGFVKDMNIKDKDIEIDRL